jgi:GT2 family glycosyltransferase
MGAQIISIPADTFTYGYAINTGIAASNAEFVLILSAHCALPGPGWLELALRHFGDGRVVGVNGTRIRRARPNPALSAEQRLIIGATEDIVMQDRPFCDAFVGFSNSCAVVRRSTCNQFPFDERMTYAEDKEWANRVTQAGHRIVFDSALGTFHGHTRKEGLRSMYRRGYEASEALTELYGHPVWTLRKAARSAALMFSNRSGVKRLGFLSPANLIDYAGRISGARHASRRGRD